MIYTSDSFTPTYDIEDADVVFLGVPFDSTALAESNQRFGPITVRYAMKNMIGYLPEKNIDPFEELKIADIGDLDWVPGSFEETSKRLKKTIEHIQDKNDRLFNIFIGGDHLITLPIVEKLKPSSIIQFDAHLDMAKQFRDYDYAHNTWAYHATSNMDVNIYNIGARSYTKEQEKLSNIISNLEKEIEKMKGPMHITIDMDVFSPCYVSDTGFPESGGLSPKEIFDAIDLIFDNKNVISMDICEISSKILNNKTSILAAKIINRVLANISGKK